MTSFAQEIMTVADAERERLLARIDELEARLAAFTSPRRVYLPSASALERVARCAGSAILPRIWEAVPAMHRGTGKHRFLQRANQVGRAGALTEIDDETQRSVCEQIDLEGLPLDPAIYVPEVTFAWNVETGEARELGRCLERDYAGVGDDEIPGTADIVALVGEDAVFVADWKSLWDPQPPARRHRQLRFLGMAAARAYDRERAIVELIRPSADGAYRDRAELDLFDLAEVAEENREIARAVRRSALGAPELTVGEHCRRCPAIRLCPAHQAMLRVLVREDQDRLLLLFEQGLHDGNAAAAYDKLEALTVLLDKLWETLQAFTMQHPIYLGGDSVYGPEERHRDKINGRVAFNVLHELLGGDLAAAWEYAKVTVTKKALEELARARAAKLKGKKGAIKTAFEEIRQLILAAGGWKTETVTEIRKHRLKEGP